MPEPNGNGDNVTVKMGSSLFVKVLIYLIVAMGGVLAGGPISRIVFPVESGSKEKPPNGEAYKVRDVDTALALERLTNSITGVLTEVQELRAEVTDLQRFRYRLEGREGTKP